MVYNLFKLYREGSGKFFYRTLADHHKKAVQLLTQNNLQEAYMELKELGDASLLLKMQCYLFAVNFNEEAVSRIRSAYLKHMTYGEGRTGLRHP